MRSRYFQFILVGLVLLLGIGQSTSNVQAQTEEPATYKLYVGQLTDNPDVFVGLAISKDAATLYICDGQADKKTVKFGEWFIGTVKDNAIDITNPSGNRVQVSLTDPAADGQFTFSDNSVKKFSLKLDPDAQLLRSEFTLDGETYIAGWIILADGSVRGSLKRPNGDLTPAYINAYLSKKEN